MARDSALTKHGARQVLRTGDRVALIPYYFNGMAVRPLALLAAFLQDDGSD